MRSGSLFRIRTLAFLLLTLVLSIAIACGSDGGSESSGDGDVQSGADDVQIESEVTNPDGSFNPDSFVAAGWKKSKQYSTETVPDASEIWYGFFSQRDIEIRFYDSHEDALSKGVPVAESAIADSVKRSRGGRLLDVSGGSFSAYNGYVVAGNAVLLCELDISHCRDLVANLE